MIDDEVQALQAVVRESAETVRLLNVLQVAIQDRPSERRATITVLPARLEVVPAAAAVGFALAAKG
jgi:hypothetical protein